MRRRVALGLVIVGAALGIAFAVVLVRPILDRPSGAEPGPEVFSGLQPLADDLAWIYRTESSQVPEPDVPLVFAVVGKESVGSETRWLLQTGIGQSPWTTRLVLADRGGEFWALAADGLEDGRWKRFTFTTPQLFQPLGGDRTWKVDYAGGPEAWSFSGTWTQRASGRMTVLGRSGDAWLVEGDLLFGESRSREIDTLVDGIGLTSITTFFEGSQPIRWDLVRFGRQPEALAGTYRSSTEETQLTLSVGTPTTTLRLGDAPADPVTDWRVDGTTVTFSADDGTSAIRWVGRLAAAGLLGTATRADGSTAVMDFVRIGGERPDSSPGSSP